MSGVTTAATATATTTSDTDYFEAFLSSQSRAQFVPRPKSDGHILFPTAANLRIARAEAAIRVAVKYPNDKKVQEKADEIVRLAAWQSSDASRLSRKDLQAVVSHMCDDVNFRSANPHLTDGHIQRLRALHWPRERPDVEVLAPNGIDKVVKYPRSELVILIIRVVANIVHPQSSFADIATIFIILPFGVSTTILTMRSVTLPAVTLTSTCVTTTRK